MMMGLYGECLLALSDTSYMKDEGEDEEVLRFNQGMSLSIDLGGKGRRRNNLPCFFSFVK